MDWKAFYRGELVSDAGRKSVVAALARHAQGDDAVVAALRGRGVVSFPHTTVFDSAEPIARVVQSIFATGATHVVALGVLHGGTLPTAHRRAIAEFHRGSPHADEIFRRLGGAFFETGAAETPYGAVPAGPAPSTTAFVRADPAILVGEFSLDLFAAVLAEAARGRGVAPPAVTRIFVSLTRDPSGSFDVASEVASAVRGLLGGGACCVATGDLVHYGCSYSAPEEMTGMPATTAALESHFARRVGGMLALGVAGRDEAAYAIASEELRSDQRHLMPVIARLFAPRGTAKVLSFRLSDYSAINGVPSPCVVASALVTFLHA